MSVSSLDDPLNFIRAEDFFASAQRFTGPTKIKKVQISSNPRRPTDPIILERGIALLFDDRTICVIQFIRPTLWRVRYDPTVKSLNGYRDENTRTIVQDYMSRLTHQLDLEERCYWNTTLSMSGDGKHYIFSSVRYNSPEDLMASKNGKVITMIYLYKHPFRIQVVRRLHAAPDIYPIPASHPTLSVVREAEKVVWQTSEKTFRWKFEEPLVKNIVLDVVKAGPGEFLGFGEQGGKNFLKKPSFMNYYNFDNMLYNQTYNVGALDNREPLYHSDPYFLDVNSNPSYQNVTATFIDNYSQVCIDFAKTNAGRIKLATRFGGMDVYLMSAKDIPEVVKLYTSILGRPRLKPKYVLGHHQGCYGYMNQNDIEQAAQRYRAHEIPLDGIHIDVDFQNQYRTFTIDPRAFPNPKEILNGGPDNNDYPTLKEGLEKNYFVTDDRYTQGTSGKASDVQYVCYSGGSKITIDPKDIHQRPGFGDDYNFEQTWNSKKPYHGGVSYGGDLGAAGYYPDLNDPVVRKWWGEQYAYLFDQGLEFVWQDMTTPSIATAYGDMKGFPSRLNLTSDAICATELKKQPAIEIWALYSYNLHKATFQGLNNLPSRRNKRNFIIGRGSFAGMHRYSGLWTGDNGSTWDFWKISISQVLSLGLSGVSIVGSDIGGFMPNGNEKFCDPDLLIRWYSGAFLLPWFRNHYEPYAYTDFINKHPELEREQGWLYRSVEVVCRYYVKLRYSLIQLLYDAMFENQINGLPIARSMLMTDTLDASFYNECQDYLDSQYLVRRDLLIAPIMDSHTLNNGHTVVYLPAPNKWYTFNLRIDGSLGVALEPAIEGGSMLDFDAHISSEISHIPYITPIFIREGGIIPQIEPRQYIGDGKINPITIHVYPGRDNTYEMYLDDGVSRSSAPSILPQYASPVMVEDDFDEGDCDITANDEYREVCIQQITNGSSRTVTIHNKHDQYDARQDVGDTYTIVIWHDQGTDLKHCSVSIKDQEGGYIGQYRTDYRLAATIITIPVPEGTKDKAIIEVANIVF
ncbi:uncharacterized protein H6S33_003104 [Morchella sextelata]|uniref:uncharacterized protein n=1 Tax=Morchella sextelata TaxID=1174677 RepID=UPI001D03B0F0|nr:uncharacterized protein H6S33_003104 [Morchella sextelata]KAH0607116.1 hypothetical protein H6S33_003104 [Morchella sextelata]